MKNILWKSLKFMVAQSSWILLAPLDNNLHAYRVVKHKIKSIIILSKSMKLGPNEPLKTLEIYKKTAIYFNELTATMIWFVVVKFQILGWGGSFYTRVTSGCPRTHEEAQTEGRGQKVWSFWFFIHLCLYVADLL